MVEDWLISVPLVLGFVIFCFYQFGYSDRFPYIGKNSWRDRQHFREVFYLLEREVKKHSNNAPLPPESIERLESTADMVLKALADKHSRVEINLPNFDCGIWYRDLNFEITRAQVLNVFFD